MASKLPVPDFIKEAADQEDEVSLDLSDHGGAQHHGSDLIFNDESHIHHEED